MGILQLKKYTKMAPHSLFSASLWKAQGPKFIWKYVI